MSKIVPIELEDGTKIYIEATEDETLVADTPAPSTVPIERKRGGQKGIGGSPGALATAGTAAITQSFQAVEGTIRTYTTHTLKAFKELATANVEKVTLQFGIQIGGEAGVPYVTKGTAQSNLTITVECSFKD
ncbi:MAG: CU044_2847 family protein [Cyanobacteria bacterium J06626_23]